MAAKFVLKKTGNGRFVFNLTAPNGLVVLTSEIHNNKNAALKGIDSVRRNADNGANFERRVGKNEKPYFVLEAANQAIIGQSQMYASPSSVAKGIASVMANAAGAKVEDLTIKK